MEDAQHIDAFLDQYSSEADIRRTTLLFDRYIMRKELDNYKAIRQFNLCLEIDNAYVLLNTGWNLTVMMRLFQNGTARLSLTTSTPYTAFLLIKGISSAAVRAWICGALIA